MEACDTSMEKFYASMHKLKQTVYLDLLLKRMISHVSHMEDSCIENFSSEFLDRLCPTIY